MPLVPEPMASSVLPPTAPTTHSLSLPTAKSQETFEHHIMLRLQQIPRELSRSARPQPMEDRLRSALKCQNLGSASFFGFNSVTVVDQAAGRERIRWVREKFTKADAMNLLEYVENCRLWYVVFITSTAFHL
jgi:hypothetical protein